MRRTPSRVARSFSSLTRLLRDGLRPPPPAAWAAVLTALFLYSLTLKPRGFGAAPASSDQSFINQGEVLLHRISPGPGGSDNYTLPLASLLAAVCGDHARPWLARLWAPSLAAAEFLLVLAAALQLGSLASAAAAVALLLSLPVPTNWSGASYPQTFYTLQVLATAGLAAWWARAPSARRSLALAVCLGSSLLFRSTLAPVPVLLALLGWSSKRGAAGREGARPWVIVGVVPYLFLLPWVGMNWLVHRRLLLFENGEANHLIVGGALGLIGKYDVSWDWRSMFAASAAPRGDGAVVLWAVAEVLRHPLRFAHAYLLRAGRVFLLCPLLFVLAAPALYRRGRRPEFLAAGLLALYILGVHCALAIIPEYVVPVWPLLAVLAASGLLSLRSDAERSLERPLARLSLAILGGWLAVASVLSLLTVYTVSAYALSLRSDRTPLADRLDAAVARAPDDAWLRYERGLRRLQARELPAAAADFERAVALRPGDPEKELALAWTRLLQGDRTSFLSWGAAHAGYITPNACVLTGAGAARLDRRVESRRRLQECLERYASASPSADAAEAGPRSRWDRCSYGPLLLTHIDYWLSGVAEPERRILTEELTALTPDCDRYWRRPPVPTTTPEALAAAQTAVANSPYDASAWIQQAAAELRAGDAARAELSLSSAERLGPSAADWRRMAIVYQDSARTDKALAILDRLIADDPADAALWSDRGLCQQMLGRTSAAVRDLRKSISLDPAWLPAVLTLGSLYADQGRYRDAVLVYDAAARSSHGRPEPLREQLLQARTYALARMSAAGR